MIHELIIQIQTSAVIHSLIYHDITYDTALTVAESESDIRITTPHSSPSRVSYAVSFVRILEKIDRIIMVPHCMLKTCFPLHSCNQCISMG